jgi:hypothetical protein
MLGKRTTLSSDAGTGCGLVVELRKVLARCGREVYFALQFYRIYRNYLLAFMPYPSMPTASTMNFTQQFFENARQHFVTLSCVQRPHDKSEDKPLIFSGFLIEIENIWLYVTAGHILRDIRKAIEAGSEFETWRLADKAAIPYAFDLEKWLVIEEEKLGLDYAAVWLDPLYCRQLEAGGTVPIPKVAWGDHVIEYDHVVIVGVPSETVKYDQQNILTGRIVLMPLKKAEAPERAGRKAENQFYAKLKESGDVKDIVGMSGGPVFALKKMDGEWRYVVIGVQSGWYSSSQIIAVCPFSPFGVVLEKAIESAKASMKAMQIE